MLTKLSWNNSEQWYKNVDNAQKCLNNYPNRSTKVFPFRLLTEFNMRVENQVDLGKYIENAVINS